MVASKHRSVSLPIVLSIVSVGLSIALLVGWTLVIVRNISITKEVVQNTWLMVSGIVSFVVIMTVLVLFTVFLVREIREVRRQTTFMASVTHELKSPLASLRLCVETLARPNLTDARQTQLREMMLDDVGRLAQLIDRVLDASRVGQVQVTPERVRVGLLALVEHSARTIARRHKLKDDVIGVDVPDDVELVSDPEALRTIVDNLLDNAVKYSEDPVRVLLRAATLGQSAVRIDVIDHGIGIPRTDLAHVFDRFYRAPEEAVRARHGTGLGLYTVAALCRQLGGHVEARSEGAGKGSTFCVELPITAA
ncbi:MAG: HAMP domain-containing histidine kinase [Myxococcales bacterium FL481]|nr:MAG: HAMP domain-containing histidine kinase [Myxococcales bacterium FL481]